MHLYATPVGISCTYHKSDNLVASCGLTTHKVIAAEPGVGPSTPRALVHQLPTARSLVTRGGLIARTSIWLRTADETTTYVDDRTSQAACFLERAFISSDGTSECNESNGNGGKTSEHDQEDVLGR